MKSLPNRLFRSINPAAASAFMKFLLVVKMISTAIVPNIREICLMEVFMDKKALIRDDYFKGNIPTLEEAINKI